MKNKTIECIEDIISICLIFFFFNYIGIYYLFRENYKNSTEISNNNNYKYNTRSKYKSVSNNSYYTHYSNNNLLEQTKSVLGINYNLRKIANNYKNRKKKVVEIEYENDENIIYNKLNKLTRKQRANELSDDFLYEEASKEKEINN